MNEHEAQRIAAAVNQLRPDWPISSVLTIIRKNLLERPRRDVMVAFAWVACEANTANPARVLAIGPWWKAAGIEGSAQPREVLQPFERCGICAKPEARCRASRVADDDHLFEPDTKPDPGIDVTRVVSELKTQIAPAPVVVERTLADLLPTDPNPHAQVARAALAETDHADERPAR